MDFLDRLLRSRPLSQLPTNQEVPKTKKEEPKVAKGAKGTLRLCTMEYAEGHLIGSTFKVFDEYKRTEYLGRFFLDKHQNMVIEIKNSDDNRVELHLRKLSTGDCTFVADHQAGVSVTLSRGNPRFDRWTLRLREHKYTVTASNAGPITILWADNDKSMIARLHFYSTARVGCFSSRIVSDIHLTALLSVVMWYYRQNPDFGLERFVKLGIANRPVQGSSSDHPTLRRQTASISSADRVNANDLRLQSIGTYSVNRDDATIISRTRMLSPEPILEEPIDRENCDRGQSSHQRCHHPCEADPK